MIQLILNSSREKAFYSYHYERTDKINFKLALLLKKDLLMKFGIEIQWMYYYLDLTPDFHGF